jgi:hypothetical protein
MSQEYRFFAKFVRRVQRRLYQRRLVQGGVLTGTVVLALLLLGVAVQPLIPRLPLTAVVYSAVALLAVLALIVYVLRPAVRWVTQKQALARIEETYPGSHDDLRNALQLDAEALSRANPRGVALELVQALHRRVARQITDFTARTVVRQRRLQGVAWCAMLVLAAVGVSRLQPGALGESWLMLTRPLSYLPARAMQITIEPVQAVIARGSNLDVQAQVSGRLPRSMQIRLQRDGEAAQSYDMEGQEPGVFRYTILEPQASLSFQAVSGGYASEAGALQVVPDPAVGQLVLRYLFPDYTGLPEQVQEGGGDIQALPGTQVRLSMRANVPLASGRMRFEVGDEVPLAITDGHELRGELLVMHNDAYVIEVEDLHGLRNSRPPRFAVQVQPDALPVVEVAEPVDGMEVDETTDLRIRYEATDDFGLQDATLVYFGPGGGEQRVPMHQGRFERSSAFETFTWHVQEWELPDGDTLQFYVEVYDNDTISGPKRGVSETVTLRMRNREQEHDELEQLQEEVADAMLDLLADHLDLAAEFEEWQEQAEAGEELDPNDMAEAQERQQQAEQRAEQLAEQVDEALARVQNDPYSSYESFADLQALQRNMDRMQNSLMPSLQQSMQAMPPQNPSPSQMAEPQERLEDVLQELERMASLSEQIADNEKMQDLERLSTRMMEEQNSLLSALDDLPPDFQGGELPPELQEMLDNLQSMMQQLMEAMAQMPTAMSDEFLNSQLENMPLDDMAQQMQELREKLAEGDLEAAKKLAEELLKNMSAMVAAMQNMQQQANEGTMDAMGQQLMESANRLQDLVQRQEDILNDTQQIDQDAVKRLNEAQQQAFESAQQTVEDELNALSRQLAEWAQRSRRQPDADRMFEEVARHTLRPVFDAMKHLDEPDVPKARQAMQDAQEQLDWLQQRAAQTMPDDAGLQQQTAQAQQRMQAAQQALDSLPQDRHAMLTPPQREQLGGLSQQQAGVQVDAQQLAEELAQMMPLLPSLPGDISQNVQDAVPFMGEARDALGKQQSQPAIPPEQAALERLRSANTSMQQAMQGMQQRGQMMGMSMPMLQQAGRMPIPGMLDQMRVDEQEAGRMGTSVRNFQLPDKEAYKVPRMFREDIMEALQEGYPERYKDRIEQYYRDIVR